MTKKNFLLIFSSIICAIFISELFVKFLISEPIYNRYTEKSSSSDISSPGVPDEGFFIKTKLGTRLKRNASGVVANHHLTGTDIPLRTNNFGLRGAPVNFKKDNRVLFLGDSVTMADYLVEEETFVKMSEVYINQNSPESVQHLNAGIGSIGIEEELNILQDLGPLLSPKLVILNLYLNDLASSPAIHLKKIPTFLNWSSIIKHVYQYLSIKEFEKNQNSNELFNEEEHYSEIMELFPQAQSEENWKTNRQSFNSLIGRWFNDWGKAFHPEARNLIHSFVKKIKNESEKLNAKLLIVIHPVAQQVEADFNANEAQLGFIELFKSSNIPTLDLLPHFRSHYKDNAKQLFFDHCHHNLDGSKLAAMHISKFISKHL